MSTVKAAVGVILVGRAGVREKGVGPEVPEPRKWSFAELCGGKFVGCPGGDFAGGVVAEGEAGADGEFEVRRSASGEAVVIGLCSEEGEEGSE